MKLINQVIFDTIKVKEINDLCTFIQVYILILNLSIRNKKLIKKYRYKFIDNSRRISKDWNLRLFETIVRVPNCY